MNTWDKVTLSWVYGSFGLPTSIANEGRFDISLASPIYGSEEASHRLHKIEAVSQPCERNGQRTGVVTLDIRQSRNTTPHKGAIVDFLKATFAKQSHVSRAFPSNGVRIEPPVTESWMDTKFQLFFVLANGEQFCDCVVEIARAVFDALGIQDENGYSLANFSIKRESFVRVDDSWITFVRWLRISHLLPIYGPEDRG